MARPGEGFRLCETGARLACSAVFVSVAGLALAERGESVLRRTSSPRRDTGEPKVPGSGDPPVGVPDIDLDTGVRNQCNARSVGYELMVNVRGC